MCTAELLSVMCINVTFSGSSTTLEMQSFLEEIALMAKVSLGVNPHVVKMVGCIISERPLSLIMEYVPLGDLRSCLLAWKPMVSNILKGCILQSFA